MTSRLIGAEANKAGYMVIKNLTRHRKGRGLYEAPQEKVNYWYRKNTMRFIKNSVIAIETFISRRPAIAQMQAYGPT